MILTLKIAHHKFQKHPPFISNILREFGQKVYNQNIVFENNLIAQKEKQLVLQILKDDRSEARPISCNSSCQRHIKYNID